MGSQRPRWRRLVRAGKAIQEGTISNEAVGDAGDYCGADWFGVGGSRSGPGCDGSVESAQPRGEL